MNLKLELDLIYQNIYKLNESLSTEEFELLKIGFEDGINEGIGKWLGKAAGWVSSIPDKVSEKTKKIVDKTKDLYNKGKKWAGDVIDKISNWMSETFKKIKNWMSEAGEWISKNFNSFVEKMKDIYTKIGEKIVDLWEATKDKSRKLWEATKDFFNRVVDGIKTGWESTKERLIKMGEKLSEWVKRNWESLKKFAGNTKDKITEMFLNALEMIKKGGSKLKKWIDIVALYLIIKPTQKIKELLKRIPELYEKYTKMIEEFIDKQIQDFKLGFEETSGRPWDRKKGFIIPNEKPEWSKPNTKIDVSNPLGDVDVYKGGNGDILFPDVFKKPAVQNDIEAEAEKLVKSNIFKKKYWKYSSADLKSFLKSKGLTPISIDWILTCFEIEKDNKKVRPILTDSFKYLKTFENFKY